jgi:GT2 family glycosyltransferase
MPDRPPVSVVLPFHGSPEDARRTLAALARLELRDGDEVLVADNTGRGVVPRDGVATVIDAPDQPSAYYARNVGAAAARNPWLLFVDDDCVPAPDLLDRFFDEPPGDDVGALVGEVEGVEGQPGLVPAYARSRGHLGQQVHVEHPVRPWGVTANLLVRRAAWEDVGGFHEGIRSGGDNEFSWRLQDAGWRLGFRPAAVVAHRHRESVRALVRQAARYAAGRRWLGARYPGVVRPPALGRELVRAPAGAVVWTVRGERRRAVFKLLDLVYVAAGFGAHVLSNTPPGAPDALPAAPVAGVAGTFPDAAAPAAVPPGVPVDAVRRPVRVDRAAARRVAVAYAEDDGHLRRLGALLWLAVRVPRALLSAGPRAVALAPRARRLRRAGVRELVALDPGGARDAPALARLTGARVAG